MQQAQPELVLDLIEAFRRSKTMFTAVELGVFDSLVSGARGSADLAAELHCAAEPLDRLLESCAALGLLERTPDGLYANTPAAAAYLVRNSPQTMTGYILYSDRVLYKLWGDLSGAVREGTHRWKSVFGFEGRLFDHFFRTPEARAEFLLGMHGFGALSSPAIVRVFNLGRFRRIVDLGGGTGHLAIAACERYGSMEGVVFDLPGAVEEARRHIDVSRARERVSLAAGDFFADDLPPADLYALGRILHDWDVPKIERLLAKIHAALPAGGGLLIAEKLLDEDQPGPVPALMQSLNMLVCTEGRERKLSEYRALLAAAGFGSVEGRHTGTTLDAVLAIK